ncbi:hypothetical protein B0I35DRAFT_440222 [Stachybotrys elegans]|uniref:Uncharacterized protein n=1 Tax=Stachybotrys elegans TaxID=80388 RepID=A0A8K0WLR2_9HYPO|nr:hypothetical protein B0I35DRAFT_440222 [Stachybotrys elegans]
MDKASRAGIKAAAQSLGGLRRFQSPLSPAEQVFPVLQRWGIKPRRSQAAFIGRPNQQVRPDILYNSLPHLYHDLGVLIFEGCSREEAFQVGRILKSVNHLGGIGAQFGQPGRVPALERQPPHYHRHLRIDADANGVRSLSYEQLLVEGTPQVERLIDFSIKKLDILRDKAVLRRRVEVKMAPYESLPPLQNCVRDPEDATLVSYSQLNWASAGEATSQLELEGQVNFFYPGTGFCAGSLTIQYELLDKHSQKIAYENASSVQQRIRELKDHHVKLHKYLFRPLWYLERGIWGERWQEHTRTAKKDQEVAFEDRSKERHEREPREEVVEELFEEPSQSQSKMGRVTFDRLMKGLKLSRGHKDSRRKH